MNFAEFVRQSERAGFYILDHDFDFHYVRKQKRNVLVLRGRPFKFKYIYIRNFAFKDRKFDSYNDAYRYMLDSIAQEVIES